jgi:hypothetical protein
MISRDRAYQDSLVTKSGTAEQHIQRRHQCPITASIEGETHHLVGLLHGIEVAEDVCAPKSVDCLLRVADQDQCGVPVERAAENLPLDRVSVLELVHHDDAVALPETFGSCRPMLRVGQCVT